MCRLLQSALILLVASSAVCQIAVVTRKVKLRPACLSGEGMPIELRKILWCVLLALCAWSLIMQFQISGFQQPRTSKQPLLAASPLLSLELALSGDHFKNVIDLGDRKHNAGVIRLNTWLDLFFIALYWATFVLLAFVDRNRWTAWVISTVSIAAFLDIMEDQRLFACLSELLHKSRIEALTPGVFGYTKWTVFAIALGLLAALIHKSDERHRGILVFTLAVSAVLVLGGLASPVLMNMALICFGVAMFVCLIVYFPFTKDGVLAFIEYAQLIRFQVIFAGLLALALPIFYWLIPAIFVGLFDAKGFISFAFVVWAALQLVWAIMITSRLVLVYGPERFGIAPLALADLRTRTVFLFALLALPFLAALCLGTLDMTAAQKLLATVIGLIVALGGLFAAATVHFAVEDDSGRTANKVFPTFGVLRQKGETQDSRFWRTSDSLLNKLPPALTGGILRGGRLRSGHKLAVITLGSLLLVYLALGVVFLPDHIRSEKQPAAMFYLLFLLTIVVWFLSGAAFFLDKLRLPVFSTLLLFSLLTGIAGTDHQFTVAPASELKPLLPAEVVTAWAHTYEVNNRKRPRVAIVVATAGGGIRAAAWTTRVLTGLQEDCGSEFGSSLLVVSSVSGGSVGSMFLVSAYGADRTFPRHNVTLEGIRFDAQRSSLSAVGWGLLYPDLARTVPLLGAAFVPQTIDRGWALENNWISGWKKPPNMSEWRNDVANGGRPAVIFNATEAETGKRIIFATADIDSDKPKRFFPDAAFDMPVATAARLSATFPYVSPEARPRQGNDANRYHMADGGYYDNSGILSALQWMDAAKGPLSGYKKILLLIDASPGSIQPSKSWSWQKQLVGPIETLLKVRSTSQDDRDAIELDWTKGLAAYDQTIEFLYHTVEAEDAGNVEKSLFSRIQPDESSPLSWHLNKVQIENIETSWGAADNTAHASEVCTLLK